MIKIKYLIKWFNYRLIKTIFAENEKFENTSNFSCKR